MKAGNAEAVAPESGARPAGRRILRLALGALICTLLVGAGGVTAEAKTLHLTATVTKSKVTKVNKDASNDTVTFDLRSGSETVGQFKGSCNGPGDFFQCIQLNGHLKGIGSKLSMSVKWACGTTQPGCARDATGFVSRKGSDVGKVTFKTTTKGATKVGSRFPVTIVLGKFCQPTIISPGVELVPKGC
jgi:hypothetical protein